jgi:very-short-patch-repair endonuclease
MKNQFLPKSISFARELRKNQTPTEELLWDKLRNRRLKGFKFLRQHPIIVSKQDGKTKFFIADFYCAEKKIVVELDGGIHALQIEYDKERDMIMKDMGLVVLRFTNDEVVKNVYEVMGKIKEYLK